MDHALITQLRHDLTSANFTVDALDSLWGADAAAALTRGNTVPALRGLGHTPLATLARLFVLGRPVTESSFSAALPGCGLQGALALGLISADAHGDGDDVRPLLDLRPYSFVDALGVVSWWVASDLGEQTVGGALREDHVLGVGGASLTLASLMVANPVDTVLDLGTGCGIQAMHAARHARHVIATDISQRALDIAAFNAALNGIDSIEFRLGSLFEPVAGQRFDQIVSNPPFVITPRVPGVPLYDYRDGGMVGDAIVAAVMAGVADHLEPGGIAQLLGNWEYRASAQNQHSEDGLERAATWGADAGLDVWIIERERQDAALYAETWIRDGGTRPGPDFDRLVAAWLDDFEARGVDSVGFGYVTLRRATEGQQTLHRIERLAGTIGAGLGERIAETLAAHDSIAALTDDELSRAKLTVAADVTEERHYWPGDADPTVMTLRQGGGFGRSIPLSTGLAALVGACDGELSVRAIIAAIAQLLEVDEVELSKELLPSIRELVVTGFLKYDPAD